MVDRSRVDAGPPPRENGGGLFARISAGGAMLADREELDARLRALHDDYAWKVNAAVAEGREDLIRRLSDEYVEEAAHLLAEQSPGGVCECARCRGEAR